MWGLVRNWKRNRNWNWRNASYSIANDAGVSVERCWLANAFAIFGEQKTANDEQRWGLFIFKRVNTKLIGTVSETRLIGVVSLFFVEALKQFWGRQNYFIQCNFLGVIIHWRNGAVLNCERKWHSPANFWRSIGEDDRNRSWIRNRSTVMLIGFNLMKQSSGECESRFERRWRIVYAWLIGAIHTCEESDEFDITLWVRKFNSFGVVDVVWEKILIRINYCIFWKLKFLLKLFNKQLICFCLVYSVCIAIEVVLHLIYLTVQLNISKRVKSSEVFFLFIEQFQCINLNQAAQGNLNRTRSRCRIHCKFWNCYN